MVAGAQPQKCQTNDGTQPQADGSVDLLEKENTSILDYNVGVGFSCETGALEVR